MAPDRVRPSILAVDDDPRNLLAMEEVLRELGHEIVLARSGDEALRFLLARNFALILMDVQMPDLDGYQTAELIRTRARCRHVPIIFVTAVNKDPHHVFRGYSAGAVDYIFKPVDPLILRSKVAVFVDLFRKTEDIRRQAEIEKGLLQENLRIRSEKLRYERALRRKEAQYSLIIGALPMALYSAPATKAGFKSRSMSGNVEAITGFAAESFVRDDEFWSSRVHPEDRDRTLAEFATLGERESIIAEYRWTAADGAERHFLDQAVIVRGGQRQREEIFGIWLDITDRKELELQLHRAQRLEAIGRITGGIAHDFNNMLSVVIGNLDMLQDKTQGQAKLESLAGRALKGALRCADLTARLLAFARRQPLQPKRLDLREFVTGMADFLARTLGDTIQVAYEAVPDLPPIAADPAQLEAAFLNLVLNARDAMPEGGKLAISMTHLDGSEAAANRPAECRAGDYVVLGVRDTGAGMSPDILAKALDPFFTTKAIGHGTGLGLSTTYGFLRQLGGHLEIGSRIGEGTVVRLYFPVAGPDLGTEEHESALPALAAPPAPQPEDVVLVIEDEADVRDLAVNALAEVGFTVLAAADARSALRLLEEHKDIRLLFTDIMMPEMNGLELAAEAMQGHPDLKVLYTSGGDGTAWSAYEPLDLLRKPYRTEELLSRIGNLMARAG